MDTDEFLKRCADIEMGLHKLADDLYAALEDGAMGEETRDLVSRSKTKIRLYDEFFEVLDHDEREEAEGVLARYIDRLRRNVGKFDSKG